MQLDVTVVLIQSPKSIPTDIMIERMNRKKKKTGEVLIIFVN